MSVRSMQRDCGTGRHELTRAFAPTSRHLSKGLPPRRKTMQRFSVREPFCEHPIESKDAVRCPPVHPCTQTGTHRILRAGIWLAVLWLYLALPITAATPDATLERAIDAYTQAQAATGRGERLAGFHQAQRLFEHAAAQGARSADLYTNLGNAALQAERLGPAILAYQRALALDPDQARAHQNLRHARALLPAWVPKPESEGALESFFVWRHLLNPVEQAAIAALSFLLAALLLAVAIHRHSPLARNLAFLPLLVWLGLLLSVAIQARTGAATQAVLVADETIARAADSPNAPMRFAQPLPAGTEVEIREARAHWIHIVLANGRDAWVTRGAVEAVEVDSWRLSDGMEWMVIQ